MLFPQGRHGLGTATVVSVLRQVLGSMVRKERAERLRHGIARWCQYTHMSLKAAFDEVVSQSEVLVRGISHRGELITSLKRVKEHCEDALHEYQTRVQDTLEAQDTQIQHLEMRLQHGRMAAARLDAA